MNIIKPFQPAKGIVPTARSISTLSGDIQGEFPELSDSELTYKQDSAATGELLLMLLEALKQFRAQSGGSISISNSTSVIRNNICSIVNNFRSAAVGTSGLELLLKKIGEVFSSEAPSPQSAELLIKQLSGQIENMGISPKGHAALVSELRGGIAGADLERAPGNILKKNSELTAHLYSGKIHIHRLFDGASKAGDTSDKIGESGAGGSSGMIGTHGTSGTSSSRGGSSGAAAGISGSAEIGRDSLKRVFSSFKAALLRGVCTELITAASANTANTAISAFKSITAIVEKGADHSAESKAALNSPRGLRGAPGITVWERRNDSLSRGGKGGYKKLTELVFSNKFSGSEIPDAGRKNTAADIPAGIGAFHSDERSYPENAAGSILPVTDHSGKNTASGLFTQLSAKLFTRLSAKLSAQIFTNPSAQLSGKPHGDMTGITGGSAGAVSDVSAASAAFNSNAAYSSDSVYAVTFAREMRARLQNALAARAEGLGRVKENTLFYFQDSTKNTKWYYDRSDESTGLRRGHSAVEMPPVSGGAVMTARDTAGAIRLEPPVIPGISEVRESHESIGNQEKPSLVMAEFTRNYAPELFISLLTEKTAFRSFVPENRGGEKRSVSSVSSVSSELIYLNRYSIAGMMSGEDVSSTREIVTPRGNPRNPAYTEKPHTMPDGELSRGQARTIYNILAERTRIGGAVSSGDRAEYGEIGKTADIAEILKIAAKAENAANILKSNLFRSADNMESAKLPRSSKPVDLTELTKFTESTGAAEFTAYSGNAGKKEDTENTDSMKTAEKHGGSISAAELFRSLVLKEKAVAAGELFRYREAYPAGISAVFPDIDITLRSTGSSGFSHFSLMSSASELNEARHSDFRLAARNPLTGLTDPTALTAPISPTAPNELNELNKVNTFNLSNVLNASNVLNELNKLTARAASVLRSEIRGGLSERIVFSEKADMLNIRSVSEISGYFLGHAVNDFLRLRSKRRGTFPSPQLTDISGTPGFNELIYSARHTESAPAGHEEYDSAGGANRRKWEYLRSVRAEFMKSVRAQNFFSRKTFSVSPERYQAAFSGNVGEIAAAAANIANIADAALEAIEANRYIGGNIYRIPVRGNENLPESAPALAVYKPESAGAGASPEKPVYSAIASVSGAFPSSIKGFARRLILMERWNSGETESLITGNAPHKSSLLQRFPSGGAYLAVESAGRKSGKNGRNGTNGRNGASGIIEQIAGIYESTDIAGGSSAGGENTLYYYSSAVIPEKSGGNAPELPADRDIPDKGAEGSKEISLPPAEKIYSQLNISESVSALLSSEEAMKSYIMNQINSYFSENNAHNVNSLIQNQYYSADRLCEQVISRLERRLKTERRINGR